MKILKNEMTNSWKMGGIFNIKYIELKKMNWLALEPQMFEDIFVRILLSVVQIPKRGSAQICQGNYRLNHLWESNLTDKVTIFIFIF